MDLRVLNIIISDISYGALISVKELQDQTGLFSASTYHNIHIATVNTIVMTEMILEKAWKQKLQSDMKHYRVKKG